MTFWAEYHGLVMFFTLFYDGLGQRGEEGLIVQKALHLSDLLLIGKIDWDTPLLWKNVFGIISFVVDYNFVAYVIHLSGFTFLVLP